MEKKDEGEVEIFTTIGSAYEDCERGNYSDKEKKER